MQKTLDSVITYRNAKQGAAGSGIQRTPIRGVPCAEQGVTAVQECLEPARQELLFRR